MFILYGIPNCDTMKKARTWLDSHGIAYQFHDYKKQGISADKLQSWLSQYPWETLVNRAGTTWKKLAEEEKAMDAASALALMQAKPSLIKRPIIEAERIVAVGFRPEEYERLFRLSEL